MGRSILFLGGGGALVVALALVVFAFSGCSDTAVDGYEPTAFYPPRTDPLVLDLKRALPPTDQHPSGKLNESIAQLAERGGKLALPGELSAADQTSIRDTLIGLFGTPAAPKVEITGAAAYRLAPEKLAAGGRVFKLQCTQCHGMTGDGRGPTSLWVYPPARDFRQGQFKYVSTAGGAGWPTRNDLHRILRCGIAGNSMPPFVLRSDADLDDVASYTLHLMFRGLVEFDLIEGCLSESPPDDVAAMGRQKLTKWFNAWSEAQQKTLNPVVPTGLEPRDAGGDTVSAERVRRGYTLFLASRSACLSCHVDYGRSAAWRYDRWGVAVRPSNLTEGHPRGGGDALELFRRIRAGIVASDMPAASQLSDEEVWDLVAFLKSLPDPRHLPADVRKAIYPNVQP
jgi:mono/diheme cytochrome c family protein